MPLWRNKVLAIVAWGGHSFTAGGERNDYVKLFMYNISS